MTPTPDVPRRLVRAAHVRAAQRCVAYGSAALLVHISGPTHVHAQSPVAVRERVATDTTCAPGVVRLFALVPDTVDLSSGDRTPVVVTGCGFGAYNTVDVGPAILREIPSSGGGTRMSFVVPATLEAKGEVPPMMMPRGTLMVRVTTPAGASNALPLVLR